MKTAWLSFMMFASVLRAEELRLHFKPDDHSLGDVHPFFHQGECFLYYLKPGKFDAMLVRSRMSDGSFSTLSSTRERRPKNACPST